MFGVLRPQRGSLSAEDRSAFDMQYCSLCGSLSENFGVGSRMLLVNDIVTLAWLFEDESAPEKRFRRLNCLRGGTAFPVTESPSDLDRLLSSMSVLACGIKVADDLDDEGSLSAKLVSWKYDTQFLRAESRLGDLGFPVDRLQKQLAVQNDLESSLESDLVRASDPTADCYGMTAEWISRFSRGDIAPAMAFEIGQHLGRLVYLTDAFSDRGLDRRGSYNPLLYRSKTRLPEAAEDRLREFDNVVCRSLAEIETLAAISPGSFTRRWRSVRQTLVNRVSSDPQSVTLNLCCCIPVGEGFVACSTESLGNPLLFCCCLCACCYMTQ